MVKLQVLDFERWVCMDSLTVIMKERLTSLPIWITKFNHKKRNEINKIDKIEINQNNCDQNIPKLRLHTKPGKEDHHQIENKTTSIV